MKFRNFNLAQLEAIKEATNPSRPFAERREDLRTLVAANTDLIGIDLLGTAYYGLNHWAGGTCENSPIIGDKEDQLSLRHTFAAMRDVMTLDTLANVLVFEGTLHNVNEALVNPTREGRRSSRSKTRFAFGEHRSFKSSDNIHTMITSEIEARMKTGTTSAVQPLPAAMTALSTRSKGKAVDALLRATSEAAGSDDKDMMMAVLDKIIDADVNDMILAVRSMVRTLEQKSVAEVVASLTRHEPEAFEANLTASIKAHLKGEQGEAKASKPVTPSMAMPPLEIAEVVDLMLSKHKLPSITTIINQANLVNDRDNDLVERDMQIIDLKEQLARARASAALPAPIIMAEPEVKASGEIPAGTITTRKANEVFGMDSKLLDFDVPYWEWDGQHPSVNPVDPNYIFRERELLDVLLGLVKNKPTYLHGDTGTGKTSLVMQTANYLHWPSFRINFDSEITRMDLIGRDVLEVEAGASVSRFEDGVLPQHIVGPYVMCYDEIDASRPDVSYVFQRVLENDALVLTEDGGRVVKPHPMHRIFATGNTAGQGDERGLYQAPRQQSLALLDRFTKFIHVDYLDAGQRRKLILNAAPNLSNDEVNVVAQYVTEHLEAFKDRRIMLPVSPRGFTNLADTLQTLLALYPKDAAGRKKAFMHAFDSTMLSRATERDRSVLEGIVQRVMK